MDNRILLVDDEEDIRTVLGISLADMGYDVLTAENGEDGLRVFMEETPPIVLTDIKMPDMDGIELLRKIKNIDPEVEVIMITGHGDMDLAIESFQSEASDFITKPIDVDALEMSIKRVCEKILTRMKLKEYTENLEGMVFKKTERLAELESLINREDFRREYENIQERFKGLFDEMPCYVAVMNSDLAIVEANRQLKSEFGDSNGAMCHELLKQTEKACPDCPVKETFGNGQPRQAQMELKSAKGRKHIVLAWTSPVFGAGGKVDQVLVMYADMTQILQVQNHLASLGLLVGSISHGIKGLLTGLDGGLYLLDSGLAKSNDDKIREGLDIVKMNIGRIRNLVLDMLLFSKERDPDKEIVNVRTFLTEIAGIVRTRAKLHGLTFFSDFEKVDGSFEIDKSYLRSALINVLENAVEACGEDHSKSSHTVKFEAEGFSDYVLINVEDDGVGMDEETREKVFDLFFSSKGRKGTGLGLFITRNVVEQHNGRIEIISERGKGTKFTIQLPRKSQIDGGRNNMQ